MTTPKTDAVDQYLRSRQSYEKTDHQVWREHGELLEKQLNEAQDLIRAYETHLGSVMPPDFKSWHENSRTEWPLVAKLVIEGLRSQLEMVDRCVEEQSRIIESRTHDPKLVH